MGPASRHFASKNWVKVALQAHRDTQTQVTSPANPAAASPPRSARKLCLILDLDHTLLCSATFAEVDPPLARWLDAAAAAQAALPFERRDLFRLEGVKVRAGAAP